MRESVTFPQNGFVARQCNISIEASFFGSNIGNYVGAISNINCIMDITRCTFESNYGSTTGTAGAIDQMGGIGCHDQMTVGEHYTVDGYSAHVERDHPSCTKLHISASVFQDNVAEGSGNQIMLGYHLPGAPGASPFERSGGILTLRDSIFEMTSPSRYWNDPPRGNTESYDHISIGRVPVFDNGSYCIYIYNTSFDPMVPGKLVASRHHNAPQRVVASIQIQYEVGCSAYPCEPGHSCSYSNYSLMCEACEGGTVSSDGLACTPCAPGFGPDESRATCVACSPGEYSPAGLCQNCTEPQIIDGGRTSCSTCPAGQGHNHNFTQCSPCAANEYSTYGVCQQCAPGEVPNTRQTICEACGPGTEPSPSGTRCLCDSTSYNASEVQIRCHETDYEDQVGVETVTDEGCSLCGPCVDCNAWAEVQDGYIRLNVPAVHAHQKIDRPTIDIFRCKASRGCFGLVSVDTSLGGCMSDRYTGYFCETCADNFEMKRNEATSSGFSCVECTDTSSGQTRVFGAIAVAVIAALIALRKRIISLYTKDATRVAAVFATLRSAWQPIRIMITYAQVTSQIGSVLSIDFPSLFTGVIDLLGQLMDAINIFSGSKCLGFDGFHYKWMMQVVVLPLVLLSVAFVAFHIERTRANAAGISAASAMVHFTANVFFIVFFTYPRICTSAFNVFICRVVQLAPQRMSILVADDRIVCEGETHVIYQWCSRLVIFFISFGVPIGAAIILYRERQRQLQTPIAEQLKLQVAGAFGLSVQGAEDACYNIKLGSKYGFLTDAFKPQYFMWESMDMLRKLMLVGLVLVFDRGSVAQIAIALIMSFCFLAAHMRFWPYKLDLDNQFRAATEFHVFLTLTVGLVFKTDLDSPLAAARVRSTSLDIERQYADSIDARKAYYDYLLISTFVVLVVASFVATIVLKVSLVARLLTADSEMSGSTCSKNGLETRMRDAYRRFQLGLAAGSDHKDLDDFLDQLVVNDHVKAGKALWRTKQVVAHMSAAEMMATLAEMNEQLPKSETLGYHFTDMDACRLILNSNGLRASNVGQLGGGVSICLASLPDLGWEKHGGSAFCKRVGEELWGSKWYEVMPPPAPEGAHADWGKYYNKLECVFVVRIPSDENKDQSRIVPGRPNVYIVSKAQCVPAPDDENVYYSNQKIEACFVLKPPAPGVESDALDELATRDVPVRVKIQSDRDGNGGMKDITFKEVDESARIPDKLDNNPAAPWCPIVSSCTAMVGKPPDRDGSMLRMHERLQLEMASKQHWPENIARFTPDEMVAALKQIDQALPHPYTMAYYYTTAHAASKMCKDGKGIVATVQPGGGKGAGVTVSLRSPTDLGWEKHAGGAFQETAGTMLWGSRWREMHGNRLEAVLVMGVPTTELDKLGDRARRSGEYTISETLLVSDPKGGEPYYANAHIHKSYLISPPTVARTPRSIDTQTTSDLAALFAAVDADGDGQITQEEALQYLRTKDSTLDATYISMIWETLDTDGNGTLDTSEFPGFIKAVDRAAAKVRADGVACAPGPLTENNQPMHETSAQALFDRVDKDDSGLISFDEFITWWSQKKLATGGRLDKHLAAEVQQEWDKLDADGSGDLDRNEFDSLMAKLATSEWKEAFDEKKGKTYYYNVNTKRTKWQLPDKDSAIADFMQANGLATNKPPPTPTGSLTAPATLSPRPRGRTTANPLAQAETTFDVDVPTAATGGAPAMPRALPQLDDLRRRHAPKALGRSSRQVLARPAALNRSTTAAKSRSETTVNPVSQAGTTFDVEEPIVEIARQSNHHTSAAPARTAGAVQAVSRTPPRLVDLRQREPQAVAASTPSSRALPPRPTSSSSKGGSRSSSKGGSVV